MFQQMVTQPDLAADLIRMLVKRILEEVFPDETGAARLQEVGLFTLIFMLQNDEAPVTATRLAEMTGQATSRVTRLLRKLFARDLVQRTKILNKGGRGYAWHLSVKHNEKTRLLADAIRQASVAPPKE